MFLPTSLLELRKCDQKGVFLREIHLREAKLFYVK